ncbi:DUF4190 domain-containing protein [Cellulosimicrobium arenosum]|uniref:DUF4190 domain-containing protein n=1 Tax=Cellulosimicrobium arenosum TaxID=2708133 RepID=A0A927G6X3_9MICO|nr:DUF4190 domain-containing protein [Cellulosimicrobium arenosum]MBD8077670.1 DUF4190 domain-containing protein [Cellulosimicrobium arenosum]
MTQPPGPDGSPERPGPHRAEDQPPQGQPPQDQPPHGQAYPQGYPASDAAGVPPYAAAPPGYGYAPTPYPRNDLAVWSLVLGIASYVLSCGLFTGIPAVIVGYKARGAVQAGEANNGGMATAGIILGWVAIGLSVAAVVLLVLFVPAFLYTVGSTIPDQP